jgi:RNA polymerase sigma-70 factor (ECF subfamily)
MPSPVSPSVWDRFRVYLLFLGRQQTTAEGTARVDLSGVVQQTLLEAHQAAQLPALELGQQMGWLRKALARNLADEFRRLNAGKRDVRRERRLQASVDGSSAAMADWLDAGISSPSMKAERNERLLRLAEALQALPDAQRRAVEGHYFQSKPLSALAAELDRTPAAVAGLLKRGLAALRAVLAEPE